MTPSNIRGDATPQMHQATAGEVHLEPFLPVVTYCCRGDDRWTCLHVSEVLRTTFGVRPDAWTSDPLAWLERIHADDRDHVIMDRLAAVAERRRLSTEYRLRTDDGRYRWVHDEAEPHWRSENEEPLMYGVITDITRRRHSDVILSELYEASRLQVTRLQEKLEQRDLFTQLLAHDVRSPLSAAAVALEAAASDDGEAEKFIARARQAVADVRSLIDDIVDFGRWSGDRVLRIFRVTVAEAADLALAAVDTDQRRVQVDLPDAVIQVDPLIVSHALANLVGNAIRHTPDDGAVRLRAYVQDLPRSIIFTVEDEGAGIPDAIRDDVFRPFVTSRPSYEGSHGLGLSLVQRMAELHGGRVWFEDLPTGGLAFHLLIPQE